jgi:hypothetical protein
MHRAFVVQFKPASLAKPLSGRVEHLPSGRVAHFESVGELVEFFFRSLESEEVEESSRFPVGEKKEKEKEP